MFRKIVSVLAPYSDAKLLGVQGGVALAPSAGAGVDHDIAAFERGDSGSVVNDQCSTSCGSTDFCSWLVPAIPGSGG